MSEKQRPATTAMIARQPDADHERQRLANICASQRGQLAHDWFRVHEALSPSRNIKRMVRPVSGGLLALGGGLLVIIWLLRTRTVFLRQRLSYYLRKLAWLPRFWLSGRAANLYELLRRFV